MTQTVRWPRPNGSAYVFELYPFRTNFNPVPGVYIFCKSVQSGWKALYVGQASNLNDRVGCGLANHHAYLAATRAGATHVCVMRVQAANDRDAIERELCGFLSPSVNQQLVR